MKKTDEKIDYAVIHKFCVSCSKEKVFNCAIKRGFYKGTIDLMKLGWLCPECSGNGQEQIGDKLLLQMWADGVKK